MFHKFATFATQNRRSLMLSATALSTACLMSENEKITGFIKGPLSMSSLVKPAAFANPLQSMLLAPSGLFGLSQAAFAEARDPYWRSRANQPIDSTRDDIALLAGNANPDLSEKVARRLGM